MAVPTLARCRGIARNRRQHSAIAMARALPGLSVMLAEEVLTAESACRACRVCGCTQLQACPGGCYWVEPDLCSACKEAGD